MKNVLRLTASVIAMVMAAAALVSCAAGTPANTVTDAKPAETTGAETTAGADVTTGAEATTAEAATEENKTEYFDVFRWDFSDSSDPGWTPTNMTDVVKGEDGILCLSVKGEDPHITTKKLPFEIDCDDVEVLEIRVKNKTNSHSGQIFITTTDSPGPSDAYSFRFAYENAGEDDEWELLRIDTFEINGWTGILKSLRLDYSDGSEGECSIDYIALMTSDRSKADQS